MPETQRRQGWTCLFQSQNKQLISNFEAEIAGKAKQLEGQPKNGVAYKKSVLKLDMVRQSEARHILRIF